MSCLLACPVRLQDELVTVINRSLEVAAKVFQSISFSIDEICSRS